MNKALINRINRAVGQLESLKKEVSKDDYDCEYVIKQLKVIVGSIKSLGQAVAQEDIDKCLSKNISVEEKRRRLELIVETAFK